MAEVLIICILIAVLSAAAIAGLLTLLVDYWQLAIRAAHLQAESQIEAATRRTLQAMRDAARQTHRG